MDEARQGEQKKVQYGGAAATRLSHLKDRKGGFFP
jgi:hypothetical protein